MAYIISSECIACGGCVSECPVSAISETDRRYSIDADECVDCGVCVETCPTGAILTEQEFLTH
ncbi:4Fe-4S binding protein [Eubacterium sp. 1001713B170207_170306_E7]|uniref:DUF362 domain-containing protein n=1 Tax=Eubacterium sp. 1001713B170207_170306_E7 TaxID=2787097 RepID=UPI0018975D7F|nr:4Fe-4S binding protein [Eubacterium sp. 1001713B170207_170306_E7]